VITFCDYMQKGEREDKRRVEVGLSANREKKPGHQKKSRRFCVREGEKGVGGGAKPRVEFLRVLGGGEGGQGGAECLKRRRPEKHKNGTGAVKKMGSRPQTGRERVQQSSEKLSHRGKGQGGD